MSMGWICLHRSIRENWIWETDRYIKAWITILLEVNHAPRKIAREGGIVTIERGQSCKTLETWALTFGKGWTVPKVRTFFKLLESDTMIARTKHGKLGVITVVNYSTYQDLNANKNVEIAAKEHDNSRTRAEREQNDQSKIAPNNHYKQLITTNNNENIQEHARILDQADDSELDIGTDFERKPLSDEQMWAGEMNQPWVQTLKKFTSKVTRNSWQQYKDLLDNEFKGNAGDMADFMRKLPSDMHWADKVRVNVRKQRPDLSAAATGKKVIIL